MGKPKRRDERGRSQAIRAVLLGLVIFTAHEYGQWTYDSLSRAQIIVGGLEERPYVYRMLVPWLADRLVVLGLRADLALLLLVILSAIGLFYGIKYLLAAFRRA